MDESQRIKVLYDYQIFMDQVYGGVSRYYIELSKELEKNSKIKVEFSAKYFVNKYLEKILGTKANTVSRNKLLKKYQLKFFYYIDGIKSCLDAKNADIVHITWNRPYLNKYASKKMVVTIHDMIHELLFEKENAVNEAIRDKKSAIYESAAIIAISENTKRDILKIYPDIPESKITVIYHGTNHLPKAQRPIATIPENYILYVGKRFEYKGADILYEAFAQVKKNNDTLYLVLAGGGELNEDEIKKCHSLGIDKDIYHMSVTDSELAYLYSHAKCFVYPSHYEGFGFPILEAFDNNCPVICTDSSSLPEVGGDAAIYFEENNTESLIRQLEKIVNDNEFRQQRIALGRERVKRFTWEKCAKETFELYKRIAKK